MRSWTGPERSSDDAAARAERRRDHRQLTGLLVLDRCPSGGDEELSIAVDEPETASDDDRLGVERVDERGESESELAGGLLDQSCTSGVADDELRSFDSGSLGEGEPSRPALDGRRADHDRVATSARVWIPPQDEAAAHPASDREVEERLEAGGLAEPRLCSSRCADVGLDGDVAVTAEGGRKVQTAPVDAEGARRQSRKIHE